MKRKPKIYKEEEHNGSETTVYDFSKKTDNNYKKRKRLKNKADKVMQEWGRRTYKSCIVCGKDMSCLHHFYPKSMASALRYEKDNLIPLCAGCHFKHHNGDPRIHASICHLKGDLWYKQLMEKKYYIIKPSIKYYQDIIKKYGEDNS